MRRRASFWLEGFFDQLKKALASHVAYLFRLIFQYFDEFSASGSHDDFVVVVEIVTPAARFYKTYIYQISKAAKDDAIAGTRS